MKLLLIPITWTILWAGPVAAAFLWGRWLPWSLIGIALAWIAWHAAGPASVQRWGYAERDEDVYLTQGLFSRTLTCVPYGRMQLVNVGSTLQRAFGLATRRW